MEPAAVHAILSSIDKKDKEILRRLYDPNSFRPTEHQTHAPLDWTKMSVHVASVVRLGIWLNAPTAQRHLELMERRQLIRKIPGTIPVRWGPIPDEVVRGVILGRKEVKA